MCLPVPACLRTPSPSARPPRQHRLEKITFPLAGNPEQTHTRHRCVFPAREPEGGPTNRALCSEAPRGPYGPPRLALSTRTLGTWPQRHRPQRGAPNPSPNARSCRELQGTRSKGAMQGCSWGGDRSSPSPGAHPQLLPCCGWHSWTSPWAAASLSPCRTRPHAGHSPVPSQGCSTSSRLQLKLLPQQTPSDATNPPDPAITQLCRIWVTAVSHGHPESDSMQLQGPDPAADFPKRDSKTVRRGRTDRHHLQAPQQPPARHSG